MLTPETLILIAGVLLLLGIGSSKFSARLGVPVLVMFLGLGMLAGSEGLGGIEFESYPLANGIGTVALAMILFDGGLQTPLRSLQSAWKPAGMLATLGVLVTAIVTGLAATWALGLDLVQGLLLGSIVGSTDAAAVFSVLRTGGVRIRRGLSDTLEVESGSNDPMAIFLTVGLIQVIAGESSWGWGLVGLFLNQMIVGILVGWAMGRVGVSVINAIRLDSAGLYPLLATGFALLSFGVAAELGGSGFLAVYLTGIVIGNRRTVFHRGSLLFHDAAAWLSQILMFTVLGLLSFPSRLFDVAVPGLLIAAALVLVARPLAVWLSLLPFGFPAREQVFLGWGGLKGAVPITLATFPFLSGLTFAPLMFDVVFFVVLVSALVQGWTLPWAARRLGLELPRRSESPVTLELSSLRHVEGDIVDYYVDRDCKASERLVRDLALPEEVVVALIVRDRQIVVPRGLTRVQPGDHAIVVLRPAVRPLVDRIFAPRETSEPRLPQDLEFPLRGDTTAGDLETYYGIRIGSDPAATLDQILRSRLRDAQPRPGGSPRPGDFVRFPRIELRVRQLAADGTIETVGMVILPEPPEAEPETGAEAATETVPEGIPKGGAAANPSVPAASSSPDDPPSAGG